jgi:hypothetical protein
MPISIRIAGTHWITTTSAQKPRKSRTRGPLTKILLVVSDEASAPLLDARTMARVQQAVFTVWVLFMAISFSV